jgi:hypothetical protein
MSGEGNRHARVDLISDTRPLISAGALTSPPIKAYIFLYSNLALTFKITPFRIKIQ